MSSKPKKPSGPGTGSDWDNDVPTDVRIRAVPAVPGTETLPSVADERDHRSADDTQQYPVASHRGVSTGAALPDFLAVYLDVVSGPDDGDSHKLTMVRTVLGRGPQADIRVHDPRMSRGHASIIYTGSEFRIRDEKSANGTFLNGSRVVEYAVRSGDKILVGDTLLQFRLSRDPAR